MAGRLVAVAIFDGLIHKLMLLRVSSAESGDALLVLVQRTEVFPVLQFGLQEFLQFLEHDVEERRHLQARERGLDLPEVKLLAQRDLVEHLNLGDYSLGVWLADFQEVRIRQHEHKEHLRAEVEQTRQVEASEHVLEFFDVFETDFVLELRDLVFSLHLRVQLISQFLVKLDKNVRTLKYFAQIVKNLFQVLAKALGALKILDEAVQGGQIKAPHDLQKAGVVDSNIEQVLFEGVR